MAKKPAPKTTTADTAPTWDTRLDKLRLTSAIRSEIMGYVQHGLNIAAAPRLDNYAVRTVDFWRRFAVALVDMELKDFPACDMTRIEIFVALPDHWKRQVTSQSYYVSNETMHQDVWHLPVGLSRVFIPATYCRTFGPGQGGAWTSFWPEAKKLVAEQNKIFADVDAAKRSIQDALKGCSTMGAFLRAYPSAIELIKGSFLAELAKRAAGSPSNLMVSPKDVLCGIAQVKGLSLPECEA